MDVQQIKHTIKSYLNSYRNYVKLIAGIILFMICGISLINCASNSIPEKEQLNNVDFASVSIPNGEKIILSKDKFGVIFKENQLMYNDGAIIKSAKNRFDFLNNPRTNFFHGNPEYMIVSSPIDRMFRIVLPDSTRIWLSANSSLAIPMNFDGINNRIVRLAGEANFDVPEINVPSKQGKKRLPFTVVSKGQQTEVNGTKFNLRAFSNEEVVKTTLITGNLKITPLTGTIENPLLNNLIEARRSKLEIAKSVFLMPNQLATSTNNKLIVQNADDQEILDWDESGVEFRNTSLKKIMSLIATWYNVKVIFKIGNKSNLLLGGSIDRKSSMEDVLYMLTMTVNAKFKINKDRIVVYE